MQFFQICNSEPVRPVPGLTGEIRYIQDRGRAKPSPVLFLSLFRVNFSSVRA